MSSIGCHAGNKHALLLIPTPCKAPFAAARRPPKPRIASRRAEQNGANGKQNVKNQLGEDVLRRLKEAEEEAAALRQQLAEAKEKAQVLACIFLSTAALALGSRLCYSAQAHFRRVQTMCYALQ